jgi:chromosome segregation ATPase
MRQSLVAVPRDSQKVKELEEKVAQLQKQVEDIQKENHTVKERAKERLSRIKELTSQLQQAQDELLETKRQFQMEAADQSIQKAAMEAQIKALESNAEYRVEYEKVRARVEILEAENSELRKPRPTGSDALDRVLDAMSRMEGDIQQRKMDLTRMALKLEDKFEEEKRTMENKHKKEIEERSGQIRRMKAEFEQILSDLEKSKKRRAP